MELARRAGTEGPEGGVLAWMSDQRLGLGWVIGIPPAIKSGESGSGERLVRTAGVGQLCTGCGFQGLGEQVGTHKEAHEVESQHSRDASKGQALQDSATDAGAVAVVLGVAVVEGRGAQCGQQEGQHGCYCRMVLLGRGQIGQLGSDPILPHGAGRVGVRRGQ